VFVPKEKDSDRLKTVEIGGEVRYPGVYRIGAREKLSDLVARAGGFTEDAYYFGTKFTSEKARDIQQASIDRLIHELEIRARQVVAEQAQKASSAEDAQSAKVAEGSIEGLVGRLKSVRAEGRVTIQLANLETFRNSPYDFVLDDGDKLLVPKKPSFVAVVGSVYSPSSFLYQPDLRLEDYLDKSGGPTGTADKKHIFVLKANGEVVSKAQSGTFFSAFDSMTLMPGDTLVVPEDLERIPYVKLVKDVADIVFKIATTAGIAYAIL
jgi:protein involved in polysaccharide export with SLBB domain